MIVSGMFGQQEHHPPPHVTPSSPPSEVRDEWRPPGEVKEKYPLPQSAISSSKAERKKLYKALEKNMVSLTLPSMSSSDFDPMSISSRLGNN